MVPKTATASPSDHFDKKHAEQLGGVKQRYLSCKHPKCKREGTGVRPVLEPFKNQEPHKEAPRRQTAGLSVFSLHYLMF